MTGRSFAFHGKKKKREYPESHLQKVIVSHLLLSDAFYFSIPNERNCGVEMMARLKAMGLYPGIADLGIVVDGKIHFLEVKAPDGVQSASQRDFQKRCQANNIPYAICFSLTEALAYLQHWRAIRPVKIAT